VEELPPLEVMPRSSISVWPGPSLFSDTPGTDWASVVKSVMPRACRSWPPIAVMLIGVSCTVELRFCAVTTTSETKAALPATGAESARASKATDIAVLLNNAVMASFMLVVISGSPFYHPGFPAHDLISTE